MGSHNCTLKMTGLGISSILSSLFASIYFNIVLTGAYELKPESLQKHKEYCDIVARDPYFEPEMVLGKPWRAFYSWNLKMDKKCMNMVFRHATPQIVQRTMTDMYDYMQQQPSWDAATLFATIGKGHQLLLLADQGPAGSFVGVPNVMRDANIPPERQGVPLLKFQLKLLREGKFLVMADCHTGVSSLMARADEIPYRSEILSAIDEAKLNLGDGFLACIDETNMGEIVPEISIE